MAAKPDPLLARHGIPADPVIEAYKPGVDRTLLRENLKLTPAQRLAQLQAMADFVEVARRSRSAARD